VRYDIFIFGGKELLKNRNRQAALKSTPSRVYYSVAKLSYTHTKKPITFYDTVMSTCTAIVEKKTLMTN